MTNGGLQQQQAPSLHNEPWLCVSCASMCSCPGWAAFELRSIRSTGQDTDLKAFQHLRDSAHSDSFIAAFGLNLWATPLCNNIMKSSLMKCQDGGDETAFSALRWTLGNIWITTRVQKRFVSVTIANWAGVLGWVFLMFRVSPPFLWCRASLLSGNADMLLMKQLPGACAEQGEEVKLGRDSHTFSIAIG